jgi:hypothetical protein
MLDADHMIPPQNRPGSRIRRAATSTMAHADGGLLEEYPAGLATGHALYGQIRAIRFGGHPVIVPSPRKPVNEKARVVTAGFLLGRHNSCSRRGRAAAAIAEEPETG